MGKVYSVVSHRIVRSLNRFNVENRAHKIISQDKPVPAPKHEATIKEMEMLMRDHGEEFEKLKKKDFQLDKNLKQVYVLSHDPEPVNRNYGKPSEKMRLPSSRLSKEDSDLGYIEAFDVPEGKLSLKQAMKFLADFHTDPNTFNASYVSKEYKIAKSDAENVLKYFKTFNIYIPEKKDKLTNKEKDFNLFKIATAATAEEIPKQIK